MDELSYTQKQRLSYIDFKLLFTGVVTRNEIVSHFKLGVAAASRDLTTYKTLAPNNMRYDHAVKKYFITEQFKPLFEHEPALALTKLANQIGDGVDAINDMPFPVVSPSKLNVPNLLTVAKVTQAIINKKALSITYVSLSSGEATREIVPHTLVDNGLRWHVRAFDRKNQEFRDFVLTRITKAKLTDTTHPQEDKQQDKQWHNKIPLQIVPHPNNVKHPSAIELDFAMQNGILSLEVNAAMAGYLLRMWNVDCTPDASQSGAEYQLYLVNRDNLKSGINLAIAPGYME